jgi:hypothetical protein
MNWLQRLMAHYRRFVESFGDCHIPGDANLGAFFSLFCGIAKKDRQKPKLTVTRGELEVKKEPFLR